MKKRRFLACTHQESSLQYKSGGLQVSKHLKEDKKEFWLESSLQNLNDANNSIW